MMTTCTSWILTSLQMLVRTMMTTKGTEAPNPRVQRIDGARGRDDRRDRDPVAPPAARRAAPELWDKALRLLSPYTSVAQPVYLDRLVIDGRTGSPCRLDWSVLRSSFIEAVQAEFAAWIRPDQPHFSSQLDFAVGRFEEGAALVRFFGLVSGPSLPVIDVLDLGSGNGGVALAFANCLLYRVHTLDVVPNRLLSRFQRSLEVPLRPAVGDGSVLPYRNDSLDIVLLLDVIEHVKDARRMGAEIMRVLRPGGLCLVSTAARLRYLARPDPHYGVKGLVALPNVLQRFFVNHIVRRRIRTADGRSWPAYDVEHTYWHVEEIARLFPGRDSAEGLYAYPMHPGRVFTRAWLRRCLRGFLFHHVLVRKGWRR